MLAPDANVLVIAVARIGDTLLITPTLRALKQVSPRGQLTCMAHPKRMDVLQHLPFIDNLKPITKGRARWRGYFGGKKFDYAFVYGHDEALIKFAMRVSPRVIAFQQRSAKLNHRLFRAVAPPTQSTHAVSERLMLLDAVGVPAAGYRAAYQIAPTEREWAIREIERTNIVSSVRVGLQLMSFPTKAYRDWPEENYVALAKRIQQALPGVHFLLFGDERGRAPAERFRAHFPNRATNYSGSLSLRESAALMGQLHLYIGIDTGPTHLAGALGIPMVAMYHWRHPGKYLAPREHPAPLSVLEHPGAEAGESMSAVPVDEVWRAVQPLLALLPNAGAAARREADVAR